MNEAEKVGQHILNEIRELVESNGFVREIPLKSTLMSDAGIGQEDMVIFVIRDENTYQEILLLLKQLYQREQ